MTLHPTRKNDQLPPLRPILASWIKALLEGPELIRKQMEEYGSPVNIHCVDPFLENYREFAEVFERHELQHLVFFARKANKARAFVNTARQAGFGVDTASFRELQQCLALGCDPEKLVFTAAIKDRRSVYLAVQAGVLIILDNRDEWALVKAVARDLGIRARVGVRISGFRVDGEKLYSRFGFDIDNAFGEICDMMVPEDSRKLLEFSGLHFHLDGYSSRQRGIALHAAMDLTLQLQPQGLWTRFIDIGGGFLINYLERESEFEHFKSELQAAVRKQRPSVTFNNDGLGYTVKNGELEGEMKVYPYFNRQARATFLENILEVKNESGLTVSSRAHGLNLEIRLEPGRSLLDQAGITVARVAHRKKDSRGDLLVGLEMNMSQMCSSSADFLLDPIVLYREKRKKEQPVGAYFTGAYCLERDILLKRKIRLERIPDIGDLVVFPNTAGYMMHFFESEAHLFELAENLIYDAGSATFAPDNDRSFP